MIPKIACLSVLSVAIFASFALQAADEAPAGEELNPHEAQFQKMLKGAELIGNFSVIKDGQESEPKKDTYKIVDLKKMPNGFWLFTFQYGDKPAIPMPLPVKWADDTPMISLTKVAIPGLGTFSCRVLFHEGQYAGTWRHGEVIGNMWGVVKSPKAKEQ
ncbi:hypothetical protein Pan258_41220 [Symmachiella dynata]|uniref:hypothetical protein n=1 Tax=Symmachiella dynata TaxID=2527995 RepID=UPI00118B6EF4|nr:hypothetical protein [Symmachiella dynata]QDT50066.1 hypothetical protein Pan258_41220 [Symmachiella dynata]